MSAATAARVWRVGADIDTDVLAPGAYMKHGIDVIAQHCLQAVRPDFAGGVQVGDVLAAGANFGIGSSREQAAGALRHLGVAAVIAPSFSGLFFSECVQPRPAVADLPAGRRTAGRRAGAAVVAARCPTSAHS
jgi:3-isopropylmalate dehydratase small subunit